jgi:hypothetical protein
VIELNPSVSATTVPEFIAYAKANPVTTNIASAGIGTPRHMASELFQLLTNLDLLDVPYRGGAPTKGFIRLRNLLVRVRQIGALIATPARQRTNVHNKFGTKCPKNGCF